MSKILVIIDPGHGLYTAGKRCLKRLDPQETREWTLNDKVADEFIERLKEYYDVEYQRLDDPTGKRCSFKREWLKQIGLYDEYTKKRLQCHYLKHPSITQGINGGSGGGLVTFVDSRRHSSKSIEIRDRTYDALLATTGLRGNRTTQAPLYMLYNTKMPGTLLELGFMDSPTDIKQILSDKHPVQCADALINFLVNYINKKAVKPTPTPVEDLAEYVYTTDNLNVRSGRSTNHKVLATYQRELRLNLYILLMDGGVLQCPYQ